MQDKANQNWENIAEEKYRRLYDETYSSGYHAGRHNCFKKLHDCEWLIVNPEKMKEFEMALLNPCDNCENKSTWMKIGCKNDPKICKSMQKHLLAIDIKTKILNEKISIL